MTINNNKLSNFILATITVLTLIMGLIVLITPSSIFPDPSWGFQVMRSMQMGGGFNLIIGPNPGDLSKNLSTFLSWWSPGQYLVPYFIKIIFHINTGHAAAITSTLGNLSGLAGFYFFFKKLGFSKIITTLSLVFIFCQQAFWIPFGFYNGGEVLLFAFEGWFLLGCVSLNKPDFKLVLFVLLSGWVGFICKSSFMWIYASGLLCLWIRLSAAEVNLFGWIKKGFWLGVPAVLSLATIYALYLSKGENPASASNGFKLAWETLGFPIASPMLAGFSVDDILNGLIFHTEGSGFSACTTLAILLIMAALSLLLIVSILYYVPNKDYRLFIIVFYCTSIVFFGYSFLKQASISYEGRHFRLIGLLIAPGIIYLVSHFKLYGQIAFAIVCMFILFKSYEFVRTTHKGNGLGAHGITGLSQQFIDQPTLDYIMALDKKATNSIFVFISADIGLEIQHNRIITVDPYDSDIAADDRVPYLGHAGPINMVLPASYDAKKLAVMLKYFPGYKNFAGTQISKNYVLYTAQ
jgi:hypothetical protein